jgi:hypothetical protein
MSNMLSKEKPIIPGASIGGVSLGDNAQEVIRELKEMNLVTSSQPFANVGRKLTEWSIEGWGLSFAEEGGEIVRISCYPGYEGRYKQFFPGISVRQVLAATEKQLFIHGMIIVDAEYGVVFEVPEIYAGECYDDIDTIYDLPDDMTFERIHVMDPEWWR